MDDSELTYIVPQSEKGVLEQRGIVLFVDRDAKDDPFLASINPRDTVKSKFIGLDLTANIELNDKETLSIIIDPITGDKLIVKGNSTLTLDIDPTGDMQLSGRYEITEGSYDFVFLQTGQAEFFYKKRQHYNLVRRSIACNDGHNCISCGGNFTIGAGHQSTADNRSATNQYV